MELDGLERKKIGVNSILGGYNMNNKHNKKGLNLYFEKCRVNNYKGYFIEQDNRIGVKLSKAWTYATSNKGNHLEFFLRRCNQVMREATTSELHEFINLMNWAIKDGWSQYMKNNDTAITVSQHEAELELEWEVI